MYTSKELAPGVFELSDGLHSSFYLVLGETGALLVDTGMAEEPLQPYLRTLTDLPVTVMVTHGHCDHVRHAAEFGKVYLSPEDLPLLPAHFARFGDVSAPAPEHFLPLTDGQTVEAGGLRVRCIALPGHSLGSMAFYESSRHLLFTGDALGSGMGVWMQLVGCAPLSRYREKLLRFSAFFESLPADTAVLTGHSEQRYMHPSGDNPVCPELVRDMADLCEDILTGHARPQEAPPMMQREYRPVWIASRGRASMVYSEQVIG